LLLRLLMTPNMGGIQRIFFCQVILMTALPQFFQTAAQLQSPGKCPSIKVIKNFDSEKYLGTWYEYSNYDNNFSNAGIGAKCDVAKYTDATEEGKPLTIGVLNRAVRENKGYFDYSAKANAVLGEPTNQEKPGKLIVNFYDPPSKRVSTTTNYNILDTDYETYTAVYLCRQIKANTKSEFLWILTREQFPAQSVVDKALSVIRSNSIDATRLKKTEQTGCPDANANSATNYHLSFASQFMVVLSLLAGRFYL